MKPVDQTKLYTPDGGHPGNCFAACIASVMDMPLWMVPPWERMFGRDYLARCDEWLGLFGKTIRCYDEHEFEAGEHYIANGRSARDVMHSVIYVDGQLAHDPHPARSGIKAVEYIYRIIAREQSA